MLHELHKTISLFLNTAASQQAVKADAGKLCQCESFRMNTITGKCDICGCDFPTAKDRNLDWTE